MRKIRLRFVELFAAIGVCCAPSLAHAADPAPTSMPSNADLARTSALLEQASETAHASRSASLAIGLGSNAVLMPTGIVLLARGGDVPHIIGTGLTATAGGALFTTFLALRRSGAERFYDTFQERRASGMNEAELLLRTETEWRALAEATANTRKTVGTIETVVGGTFAVSGACLLLAPQLGSLPRRAQYSIGAILTGSGIPFLSIGLHSLFVESPIEASWRAHRAGMPNAASVSAVNLGFAPIAGGGALLASAPF